ncbi:MAG: phosphoribosylanthranilate isomerase [Ruminococcus sp.]|nr:phosphoribosylanthranilate isomerase [Ruminococcus sp.]
MKIKVCGLTTKKEAEFLNENKVDLAGMVMFFPKSKRNITPDKAKEIISALDKRIKKVAVVVSPSYEEIKIIESLDFDYVQIHGELSEELESKINLPILKAFNIKDMSLYKRYRTSQKVVGYVFDAQEPGSGKVFDWSLVKTLPKDDKILILAGGLNPENVAKAIEYIQPDGVDVSSGVEYSDIPGKDPEKIKRFVENARKCYTK